MSHIQSTDDGLAITTSKLEQALNQLAEKDQEIKDLKEELARLRQSNSPTNATQLFSTEPSIIYFVCDGNGNEFTIETPASPKVPYPLTTKSSMEISDGEQHHLEPTVEAYWSVDEQGAINTSLNDCKPPGHRAEVSADDGLTDTCRAPSPEGCEKDSTPISDWENDSSANWHNAPSSWGVEWSDNPGPASGLFQAEEPPKENWRNEKLRPGSKSWLHSLSFGKPAHILSDEEYKDIMDLHVLPLATRLEDEDWLDSPLEHIRVDDERLFRLLTKGRELAQKCLWSFMDKNRPDIIDWGRNHDIVGQLRHLFNDGCPTAVNRALLTLRSPQFCPLGSLHYLPLRRNCDHSKRLNAIRSFSTSSNHEHVLSSWAKGRRKANRARKHNQNNRSSQRGGGSSLHKDQKEASINLSERELEFSLASLQETVQLPTQKDLSGVPAGSFRRPWKAVAVVVQALGGTHSLQQTPQKMLSGSGNRFFRTHVTINLPGDKNFVAAGDGLVPERAMHAASLHALAKMRDMDTPMIPGPPTKEELEEEKEGLLDIYNYAARYHCIPSVSIWERRGSFKIDIDMPKHGISVAINSVGSVADAEAAAAREFKRQAGLYQRRQGAGTVVVRDRLALSTSNARDFFNYCRDVGEPLGAFDVSFQYSASIWTGRLFFRHLDLDPKLEVKARRKDHTVKIANLVGALSAIEKKQHLYENFSKNLRAGNGKYLPKLRTEQVELNPGVLQELNTIKALEWPSRTVQGPSLVAQVSSEASRGTRPNHTLTPDELRIKSSRLQKTMDEYKTRGDLSHLRKTRSELPMSQYAPHVRQIMNDNVYCVIIGATGSGKTTQVPQIILDQAIDSGTGASCNVICTQPRRIAATSVARRVAAERAEQLQNTVGYHVRFDAKLPKPGGSILYCTAGILLQRLQHAPDDVYDHVSHLVIDEVHERDLINDFLLITLKHTMANRAAQGKKLPRVVLMSATIDAEQFAAYFRDSLPSEESTDCPTLSVPGRTFPVSEYYLDDVLAVMKDRHGDHNLNLLRTDKKTVEYLKTENAVMGDALADTDKPPEPIIDWKSEVAIAGVEDDFSAYDKDSALVPLGLAATAVAHITKTSESGSILVFLPGMDEIEDMDKLLRVHSPLGVDFNDVGQYQIIKLHSSIQDSQRTVFDPIPEGCRKIILSTNIAETSVTIPDVQFVVDTGKSREKRYDQTRRITQLQCTWISKSNAKQRAGRAGRVQDGAYYALFTRSRRESMRAVGLPELLRSDLQETCLDVKLQAFKMPVADFLAGAMEPPPPSAVDIAMQNLVSLGALTEQEELTPLGRVLASLPVHPTLGKMIILGIIFRCLDPMITLGAAAQQRPLFMRPRDQKSAVDEIKTDFADSSRSDHIMLLKAFGEARQASARGSREAHEMFRNNFMDRGAFKNIVLTAREIVDILTKAGLIKNHGFGKSLMYGGREMNQNSGSEALIKALLVAGLYPNIAVHTKRGAFRTPAEKDARMHPGSVNDGIPLSHKFFAYNSLSLSGDGNCMFLRETSSVTPLMALLFGGPLVRRGPVLEMDRWLPMLITRHVPGTSPDLRIGRQLAANQILFLRELLDRMLADAFEDLASQTPLFEDRMLNELAFRLARVLNQEAGLQGNLRPDYFEAQGPKLHGNRRPVDQTRASRTKDWPAAARHRPSGPFASSIPPRARRHLTDH